MRQTLMAEMLSALHTLVIEPMPLAEMQTMADAIYASYQSVFEELAESMLRLVKEVRATRFPVHLMMLNRVRNGHRQMYLYWYQNGKKTSSHVDPRPFISSAQIPRFEVLQARCVQLQTVHFTLVSVREILHRIIVTLDPEAAQKRGIALGTKRIKKSSSGSKVVAS